MSSPPTHRQLRFYSSTNLATPPGTYIYDLVPLDQLTTSGTLAAISSTDSLHIFNASTLQLLNTIPDIHLPSSGGVTCLKRVNQNVLATTGRDGVVRLWDVRNTKQVGKFGSRGKPFLSLVVNEGYNAVAAGEELVDHLASVVIWDMRNSSVTRHYTESHNDDVTELQFDPFYSDTSNPLLLSGSTDGLVNLYDLHKTKTDTKDAADDDEALFQVINHGSSIHRAGFLVHPDSKVTTDIFALSHDEILTVYPLNDIDYSSPGGLTSANLETEEKKIFGDVRQRLGCEYVLNLLPSCTSGAPAGTLIIGSHTEQNPQNQYLDLLPFTNPTGCKTGKRLSGWDIDSGNGIRLLGGHGEEVVRCVYIAGEQQGVERVVYTGGEDGLVKVWRVPGDEGGQVEEVQEVDEEEADSMVIDDEEAGDDKNDGKDDEKRRKKEQKQARRKREKEKKGKQNRSKPY